MTREVYVVIKFSLRLYIFQIVNSLSAEYFHIRSLLAIVFLFWITLKGQLHVYNVEECFENVLIFLQILNYLFT